MARFKHIDTSPRVLVVDLEWQLVPGTFEHALHHLIEHELDLSHFNVRYRNDASGATAYPPAMLLRVVLFAYSHGLVSSRLIAQACLERVTFVALSGDSQPHFTTIARFVSTLGEDIAKDFGAVLAICDRQGLIGREMLAIDGVKLPSNAAKSRSGTRAHFERQAGKHEAAVRAMVALHRAGDQRSPAPGLSAREEARCERLTRQAAELRDWLKRNPDDRRGSQGDVVKSNRTDNESAQMATHKGVTQGYTGVAAVDSRHQIICAAQAHGSDAEHALLVPIVSRLQPMLGPDSLITADAGYHSKANLLALDHLRVDALIADNQMRKRDERFSQQARHKATPDPLNDKVRTAQGRRPPRFAPRDLIHDPSSGQCLCPAGKHLYRHGSHCRIDGKDAVRFQGAKRDCVPCTLRDRCLGTPATTATRRVAFSKKSEPTRADHLLRAMRERIDSAEGRARYGERFATVELVFGNLRYNKRLNRFTLRGREKMEGRWKLFCLAHNIEKLSNASAAR